MDLFSLFEKYQQGTLREQDILLHEYNSYQKDWKGGGSLEEFPEKEEEVPRKKFSRKISKDHHQINKQRFYK